jgi:hypothetical protein
MQSDPANQASLHDLTVEFQHGGGSLWHPTFRLDHDWFRKNLIDYDFWYIYQGEGYLRDPQGRTLALHQGTCLWMMPGSLFEIWRKPGSKFGTRYFHFTLTNPNHQPVGPDSLSHVPLIGDMSTMAHFESASAGQADHQSAAQGSADGLPAGFDHEAGLQPRWCGGEPVQDGAEPGVSDSREPRSV